MENGISAGLRARVSLEKHGFSGTHSLGQNFLLDDDFLEEIVRASGVEAGDCVLEIGPGPGVMTRCLAARCRRVLAVEIDRRLEPVLSDVLAGVSNVEVVFEDVLKCDLAALLESRFPGEDVRVAANLPYYITAEVIDRLLWSGARIGDICLMLQREAAERIGAAPGEKSYGALAVRTQYMRDVESLMDVPPERFTPPPHVMSRLVRLTPRMGGARARDDAFLLRVIKSAFRMRRKTLVNNLTGDFPISREAAAEVLASLGLDARVRGEALGIDQFAHLSDALQDALEGEIS